MFPFVSSYYVRPSFGYQIGSIVKRDARMNPFPTDTISRLFVKFGAGIELKRLVQFSVDDSYYFLENATSYRNRNYLVVPEKI